MNDDIRILKKATCPSLSGRSELTYEFGYEEKSKTHLCRISETSGNGHYNSSFIPVEAILALLETAKEPFSLSIFRSLYLNQSINNVGFLGAILLKEGALISEKRRYLRGDINKFRQNVHQTLTNKSSARKPSIKKSRKQAAPPQEPEVQP